jgi:polysaccharide export outer membrane protein
MLEPTAPVTPAAAWGQTTVTPPGTEAAPVTLAAVASPAITEPPSKPAAPIVKAADWGTTVYSAPPRRAVPVPVPPPGAGCCGPAVPVMASLEPPVQGPYLLNTGDRLRVFVYGQPSLSRLYTVDQIGNIAVPLIGNVRARDRTTTELARVIADRLARDFVRDPQVTVDVAQNRPFFILGEVRLPGQYPYVSGMTVEMAVAIAGGYTERASERRFRITRRLGPLVDDIEAPAGYPLQPGDTVYVFERFL